MISSLAATEELIKHARKSISFGSRDAPPLVMVIPILKVGKLRPRAVV